jgi:putative nucleotidyltransferase with HDIG domain
MPKIFNVEKIRQFLKEAKNVPQTSPWHLENLYEHILLVFDAMRSRVGSDLHYMLCLLHDIGKPSTAKFDKFWTFKDHEPVGAAMLSQFVDPSYQHFELMKGVIAAHLAPHLKDNKSVSQELRNYYTNMYDNLPANVKNYLHYLALADSEGSISDPEEYAKAKLRIPAIEKMVESYLDLVEREQQEQK